MAALRERLAQHQRQAQTALMELPNTVGKAAAVAVPRLPRQLLAQTAVMVVAAVAVAAVGVLG